MPAIETREIGRSRTRKLIEAELMQLAPGDPLPPVRHLMKTHNVSLGRLQVILGRMDEDGLIERRTRRGNFKAGGADLARITPFVDLVVVDNDPQKRPYHGAVVEALSEQLSKSGHGLRFHRLCGERAMDDAGILVSRSDVRACILLAVEASLVNAVFARTPIKNVCLLPKRDPHTYDCPCITLSPDVTRLQLEHLWKLGHTRIGFIDRYRQNNPAWSFLIRREAYYRLMAERGLRVGPHWVVSAEQNMDQALAQMFDNEFAPTSVIVSDVQLAATYRFFESRGWRVGRDVSVIGTDDLPEATVIDPPATTVRNSSEMMAPMAMKTLNCLWSGGDVPQVQPICPQLIIRSSTAPPMNTEMDPASCSS